MSMVVQSVAQNRLDGLLATASYTATTAPVKIRLTTTAPTATAAGTELTGTGYTAGGTTITFTSASAATPTVATGPSSNLQWTNGSGGSWSIVGLELWDSAGTPKRVAYGSFTGQPIAVASGNIFQVSTNGISLSDNG